MRRRSLFIIVMFIAVLAPVFIYLIFHSPQKSTRTQVVTEADTPGTVIIDNTDYLSSILLPEQYTALSNELASYIQTKVDSSSSHASIVGKPVIAGDGSISFTLKVDPSGKQLGVNVDRSQFDKITVKIPGDNYVNTVPIFPSYRE